MDNLSLSHVYLRDLCKCSRCVDPHSKQRSFRLSDIPDDIKPIRTHWDGEYLEITWNKDLIGTEGTHTSRWHYTYLENPSINTHDVSPKSMVPLLWDSSRMQKIQHWINYEDYMTDSDEFIAAMRNLQRTGLIFVKDIPESREMVEKIATRMGPLRNTFYGMTWDVRTVPQAKNVAYTNQFLGFHMDLMYMNEPPGYQLLHCLENSCDGGESLFADAFSVANQMKTNCRREYKLLTKSKIAYEYVHEDQIYYMTRTVFDVNARTGQLRHVNYSPPFQAAVPGQKYQNKHYIYLKKALQKFAKLLEEPSNIFELKLNPGECVIFDNRRIVHARRQFNTMTGSRWLAGAYVDTDAVRSRFHICNKKNPGIWNHSNPGQSPVPLDDMSTAGSSLQSIKAAYRMGAEMVKQAEVSVQDEPVQDEPVQDEPVQDEPVQDEPVQDEPVHAEQSARENGTSQTSH
ncbi:hypothetical protein N7528_006897 [Penicillium herquei]|nr:hypothetical protein N7528_006897 [Penicillium herquei]